MSRQKKSRSVILALLSSLLLTACMPASLTSKIMEKGLESRMNSNVVDDFEDGLHMAICGAGGPMPAPKASGPCVMVIAGERVFVVDVGTDSPRNIGRMGYQIGDVEAVFLTHFHSDHLDGLGELATLRWAAGDHTQPLPVHGPRGVEKVVNGFNMAYSHDFVYRNEHHGDSVAPLSGAGMQAKPFNKPALGELALLIDDADLKVEALAVQHNPVEPAVGYRFSYKGRSILITGDTIKSANIERFAQGVDLLVHEALAPNLVKLMNKVATQTGNETMAKVTHDILDYHASPLEAAETAKAAKVGHLVYYHIVPPIVMPGQKALYLDGADDVFKPYSIAEDGLSFSLPASSDEIIKTRDGL